MRSSLFLAMLILASGPVVGMAPAPRGELNVEIHSPTAGVELTGDEVAVQVEGVASTIGGVRFIDMILLLDTSGSLKQNDPERYRSAAAIVRLAGEAG